MRIYLNDYAIVT